MENKYIKLFEDYSNINKIRNVINDYIEVDGKKLILNDTLSNNINNYSLDFNDKQNLIFKEISNAIMYNIVDKIEHKDEETYTYDKFQSLNSWEKIHNFHKDESFNNIFYGEPTDKEIKEFAKFLRDNKEDYVLLYHGTSCDIPVEEEGLKRTSNKTKKSIQSQVGYVYLSVYPNMAKRFASIAYPKKDVCVYEVFVKIKDLKPDKDQLYNKRLWGDDKTIKDNLVNSFIIGHGARVKRDIFPYEIKKYNG